MKKRIVDVLFRAVITTMNVVNSTPTLKEELACLRRKKRRLKQKALLFKFILKTLKTTI